MPEEIFNKVFSKRLKYYLNKHEMSQLDLAKHLGVGTSSVSYWCNGVKAPRMDKIDAMCDLFHCSRSDLMEEKSDSPAEPDYFYDEDARDLAQFMYDNPEYKVLFDTTRKVKREDIDFVRQMIDRVRGENNDTGC